MWVLHAPAALVFTICICVLVIMWAWDCRFAPHDWEWARHFGGYLGGNKHLLAGRFNCGQKALFWCVGLGGLVSAVSGLLLVMPLFDEPGQVLVLLAHRYGTFGLVLLILVHIYLATVGNPGTLPSIITGSVDSAWAKHHHPLWCEEARADSPPGKAPPTRS
jgi:formate dehydrogenase subunit gamma